MKSYKITPVVNSLLDKKWALLKKESWMGRWVKIADSPEREILEDLVEHLASEDEIYNIRTRTVR